MSYRKSAALLAHERLLTTLAGRIRTHQARAVRGKGERDWTTEEIAKAGRVLAGNRKATGWDRR